MKVSKEKIQFYKENGYVVIENLISSEEVDRYREIYENFLSGKINAGSNRSDLSGAADNQETEKITQIMVPGKIFPELLQMPFHQKALNIARQLSGEDMELDFDMLIDKAPFTDSPTPWHQDCAYWIDMPDKRATSCWLALDEVFEENGCMWFVPTSHKKPLRPHQPAAKGGGALECEASENEGVAIKLKPGSCTFHHGQTLHYSRGNSTANRRRAFITNFRPKKMIELERSRGFDHTGDRKVRNEKAGK
jgi:ectoine hydroxylase-related dioxygenase (phytanoyl-CoA dioxygenase family)